MLRCSLTFSSMLFLIACSQAQGEAAQEPKCREAPAAKPTDSPTGIPSDFVRFIAEDNGGHLDTAITTYEKGDVTVIFYGAVHIADEAVYQELNDRFTTCDALLYELVAPTDTRPTRDRETGFNPVSLLQKGMKTSMELAFQLDVIDYQPDNFVHADMTPQEFQDSMDERGESLMSIMFDMMINGMELQRAKADDENAPPPPAFDLVKAFRSGEGRHLLRMTMASQLEEMEMLAAGGSTLLEGRNEKCLEVLQREIGAGKKRLGIYYGAAHLPHMERRLVDDMGFQKVGHEWLVAWDCSFRKDPKYDRGLVKARRQANKDLAVIAEAMSWQRRHRSANGNDELMTMAELLTAERLGAEPYRGTRQDPWGHDYRIEQRRIGRRWQVRSFGQDGKPETDDDLVAQEPRRGGLRLF